MTTAYQINGLDCATCGAKIEDAVRKLPDVSYAVVDFANQRIYLDTTELIGRCGTWRVGMYTL
jgi:cation transport ATPase